MKAPILRKETLAPGISRMVLSAPEVAAHAAAGQFIILRPTENGERIPLTISDFDPKAGTVTIVYQVVGGTTLLLDSLRPGDTLPTFAGPLGRPSHIAGFQNAAVIGGGLGCAIALPTAAALHRGGCRVTAIAGFRSAQQVILAQEMAASSDRFLLCSDDGTAGEQGFVTGALEHLLQQGERFDMVFAIGPLPMMKAVSDLTVRWDTPCTVSMNPIMIDGTGMCGCCRLTVGGQVRFACVDGPEFDGHQVDFAEAIRRSRIYRAQEQQSREATCRLLGLEPKYPCIRAEFPGARDARRAGRPQDGLGGQAAGSGGAEAPFGRPSPCRSPIPSKLQARHFALLFPGAAARPRFACPLHRPSPAPCRAGNPADSLVQNLRRRLEPPCGPPAAFHPISP